MKISKGLLNEYLNQAFMRIQAHVFAYLLNEDENVLHALRVSIKKYRAFVVVISNLLKDDKLKLQLSALKEIFAKAGEIRELQVNRRNLQALELSQEGLFEQLENQEKALTKIFKEKIIEMIVAAYLQHQQLSSMLRGVHFDLIEKFMEKRIRKISVLMESKVNLHEARKQIKRMLYLREWLPSKYRKALGLNMDYLDELQNLIGLWHDQVRLYAYLSQQHQLSLKQLREMQIEEDKLLEAVSALKEDFDKKIKPTA